MAARGARWAHSLVAVAVLGSHAAASTAGGVAAPADQVQAGRTLYRQHCAACHGLQAEGASGWEQPDARGEMPAPPHDARGHTWKHSDAMLYRIVQEGWRDPFNRSARVTMPAFRGQLSRADTIAVIAYLKTLWTADQQRFQAEESRGHPFPPETR